MIILSSPSGAGKTTLVKLLSLVGLQHHHIQQEHRSNELDGNDYYFVNNEKFELMIKNDEFLEYASFKIFMDDKNKYI